MKRALTVAMALAIGLGFGLSLNTGSQEAAARPKYKSALKKVAKNCWFCHTKRPKTGPDAKDSAAGKKSHNYNPGGGKAKWKKANTMVAVVGKNSKKCKQCHLGNRKGKIPLKRHGELK